MRRAEREQLRDIAAVHQAIDVIARDQSAHAVRDEIDHLRARGAAHAGDVLRELRSVGAQIRRIGEILPKKAAASTASA